VIWPLGDCELTDTGRSPLALAPNHRVAKSQNHSITT
jgi:hypothetical protein